MKTRNNKQIKHFFLLLSYVFILWMVN